MVLVLSIASCGTPRRVITVDGRTFLWYWDLPSKSSGERVEHLGIKDGYHMLDYYSLGNRTFWLKYDYTVRTRAENVSRKALDEIAGKPALPQSERIER